MNYEKIPESQYAEAVVKLASQIIGIMLLIIFIPPTIGALLAIQEGWTMNKSICHCPCK